MDASVHKMSSLYSLYSPIDIIDVAVCGKDKLKRGDRAITAWKVNTALGKPHFLKGEGDRLISLFIFHPEMETERAVGEFPAELLTVNGAPGATVSLSLLPLLPHSHSLSISHLSDHRQRAAIISQGVRGRGEKRKRSCTFPMPSLSASLSNSIHPTVLWTAGLCAALHGCNCIKQKADSTCSSGSSRLVGLYVGCIASYPSPPH